MTQHVNMVLLCVAPPYHVCNPIMFAILVVHNRRRDNTFCVKCQREHLKATTGLAN